jgi:hypothetical protein
LRLLKTKIAKTTPCTVAEANEINGLRGPPGRVKLAPDSSRIPSASPADHGKINRVGLRPKSKNTSLFKHAPPARNLLS